MHLVFRFSGLLSALLLLALVSLPSLAASATESAEIWLHRMAVSLRQKNYTGVISYLRGERLESIELVHSYRDGEERARVTFLTGAEREVIRRDKGITVYAENAEVLNCELPLGFISSPLGFISGTFGENMEVYGAHYLFLLKGADRVAGRQTVEIDIRPKQADRYGYLLSVDQLSGLLLRSAMYDLIADQTVETAQFARIKFPAEISAAQLEPTIGMVSPVFETVAGSDTGHLARPTWQVGYLPGGFTFSGTQHGTVTGTMFTDGLASLSIFVEAADSSIPDLEIRVGGTVVLTRRLAGSGHQITLVGEIPVAVARRIAASVSQ